MGNRTSTEISKKKYRSSSMTAKSATKLTNNTTSFSSTKEQTLSRISAGSKTGWPLPQREGVFLPEYPAKPAIDFNDFRVLGHIGRGAFGHVLKVQRKTTCQIYAMKVLDKLEIFRQKAVQQCKDEIKIQSSLTCAFIVHARHAWQTKRHLYIILDYSERGDLFAVWTREKRFNEPTVRQYAAEMAVALDFLHRSGVIYRDLKLENVLLDVDGHIKLTDFGLSKWLNQGSTTRTICGTIQYMAPEILNNESYTHAVDWWSLGVLMYAMLVGEYPFNATQSHKAMYEAILSNTYFYPLFLSRCAVLVMTKLMQSNPKRRLTSVHQLQLEPFFLGVPFDELLHRSKTKVHYSPTWTGELGEVEKKSIYVRKAVDEPKKLNIKDKGRFSEKEKKKISRKKEKEKTDKLEKFVLPERVKYKPRHWGSGLTMNSDRLSVDLRVSHSTTKRKSLATTLTTEIDSDVRENGWTRSRPNYPLCPSHADDAQSQHSCRTLPPLHHNHVHIHHHHHHHSRHGDDHSSRAGSVGASVTNSLTPGRYRQLGYQRQSIVHTPIRSSRQSDDWGETSSSSEGEVEWQGLGFL